MKHFDRRWLMCDLARQRVFVKDEFTLWLDVLERLGYNGLGIYLEGAFAFRNTPGVIREGVLTYEDARWIVEEGKKRGIFVFPLTNVVGHMEHFFGQERNRALWQVGQPMQMNFLDERAEAFAMEIVHEYAAAFGTGFVHIGGDEVTLPPEQKMPYARFLAKIAANLLDEGIQPAVWNDMLWMEPELVEPFDRRTFIFDWNYYGHRPESPVYFREQGFENVIVCPCDNSWEGFINYQRLSGHLKARMDMPVKPDEIEAFFVDAKEAGVMNGFHTNWENALGRNMWAQWSCIARSGLYMSGLFPAGGRDDEMIERALFGRVTPYTEITYLLQDEIQRVDLDFKWCMNMREALFQQPHLEKLIREAMQEAPAFPEEHDAVLREIGEKLGEWTPESPFEEHCLKAMYGVTELIRAANEIVRAARDFKALYVRAAEVQFEHPDVSRQLLRRFIAGFRRAACEVENCRCGFENVLSGIGHTKNDLVRLNETARLVSCIADELQKRDGTLERIPLPRLEIILEHVFQGKHYI